MQLSVAIVVAVLLNGLAVVNGLPLGTNTALNEVAVRSSGFSSSSTLSNFARTLNPDRPTASAEDGRSLTDGHIDEETMINTNSAAYSVNQNLKAEVRDGPDWKRDGPDWRRDGPDWRRDGPDWRRDGRDWRDGPDWRRDGPDWRRDGPDWRRDGPDWRRDGPDWKRTTAEEIDRH